MYAKDFGEIAECVRRNEDLRSRIIRTVNMEKVAGKVTEGDDRLDELKKILCSYFSSEINFEQAVADVEMKLPRHRSVHENDNRVFSNGWANRLTKTSISRFYNQAVLMEIIDTGAKDCFIGHSASEEKDSKCSIHLAGSKHSAADMLDRLLSAYRDGNWSDDLKIPNHPHCTHTIQPA